MPGNVLFIAYQIPPIAGPAAQRHLRFLSRLPECGWQPHVLTINPDYCEEYYPQDEGLSVLLPPGLSITRACSFNPLDRFLVFKNSIVPRLRLQKSTFAKKEKNRQQAVPTRSFLQTAKNFVSELFRIPDQQIGWYPFAVAKGAGIIKKKNIDVIYSSGNPWTCHLVARSLAKRYGLPWVADFRDPWLGNTYKEDKNSFISKIEEKMENSVVSAASFVVANTEQLRQQFVFSYPEIDPDKFVHISNGYLAKLFQNLPCRKENKRMVISHVGTLYAHRSPLPLLKTVSCLKKQAVLTKENFLLRFIGIVDVQDINQDVLEKLGITDLVEFIEPVPHARALTYLANSDVLLIIQPGTKLQIPGKLFEYIAIQKTVFAVTGSGATADIVQNERLGEVADPDDIDDIVNKLQRLHAMYEHGELSGLRKCSQLEKYESLPVTRQLVSLLEKSVSCSRTDHGGK